MTFHSAPTPIMVHVRAHDGDEPHSHIQHVRVCELHKEIFVLEHP